jgi:hypothetical protein
MMAIKKNIWQCNASDFAPFFAPFAGQTMPNIAKDCHENEKNTLDKNRLKASRYAEIEGFY